MGIAIQAAHAGSDNLGTVVYLWVKYVSYSQHTATRIHIEEKSRIQFVTILLGNLWQLEKV